MIFGKASCFMTARGCCLLATACLRLRCPVCGHELRRQENDDVWLGENRHWHQSLQRDETPASGASEEMRRVQTATRLTHHFALIDDTALSVLCKSLHAREDRIGVEMRFRDDVRFEATASPAVIKIGCQ